MELPNELQTVLILWTDGFRNDDFAENASGKGVIAYPYHLKKPSSTSTC